MTSQAKGDYTMSTSVHRPLRVFICYTKSDFQLVYSLYQKLVSDGIDTWLDEEKLLPGQDWEHQIKTAARKSDVFIVVLSQKSITKEGYVQKEIKLAIDIADEKPENAIFLIPARLEICDVPLRLSKWQWVDLFKDNGYEKLLKSLSIRANEVGADISKITLPLKNKLFSECSRGLICIACKVGNRVNTRTKSSSKSFWLSRKVACWARNRKNLSFNKTHHVFDRRKRGKP